VPPELVATTIVTVSGLVIYLLGFRSRWRWVGLVLILVGLSVFVALTAVAIVGME